MSVYAVHNITFEVNTGTPSVPVFTEVEDVETLDDSFDQNTEEWTPLTTDGWIRRLITGKGITLSLSGKRNIGDTGNDYISSLGLGDVTDQNEQLIKIIFPLQDGDITPAEFEIPCVIEVTKAFGGDSTDVGGLEFAVKSDGKPTFTASTS